MATPQRRTVRLEQDTATFINLHPTGTAGRRLRTLDQSGPMLSSRGDESRRVSCRQCGFSGIDMDRDPLHVTEGFGNVGTESEGDGVGSSTISVPAKRAGCPHCFSSLYI